jgi:hypothetical protein
VFLISPRSSFFSLSPFSFLVSITPRYYERGMELLAGGS